MVCPLKNQLPASPPTAAPVVPVAAQPVAIPTAAIPPTPSVIRTPKSFPRSADRKGYSVKEGDQTVPFYGPFSEVMALRVCNTSLNQTVWVYAQGITDLDHAIPVRPDSTIRMQFDWPTDNNIARVTQLDLVLHAEGNDTDAFVDIWIE